MDGKEAQESAPAPKDLSAPYLGLLYQGFLSIAEFRDPETGAHLERMAIASRLLAEAAASHPGYEAASDPAWRQRLFEAAPLHDIGKIAIPDRILLKPGKLSPSEWEIMKAHTLYGRNLLGSIGRRFGSEIPPVICMGMRVAGFHHERWDGKGYPQGLAGTNIPLEARIVAITDVYDAVTSPRPYRHGCFTHEEAVELLAAERGRMFDPHLVDAFLRVADAIKHESQRLADKPAIPERARPLTTRLPRPASILVVDDEDIIRELLKRYLTQEGYYVETAANVSQARAMLARHPFDLVTLDIRMPGESGMELLQELAPRAPDTVVIMMTAQADVRTGIQALKKGAYDYLLKPLELDEVLLAIQRALHYRELELENWAYLTRLELTVAYRDRMASAPPDASST